MADACAGGDGSVGGDGGRDSHAAVVACVCVDADRLTEVTEVAVADACEGGDGNVGGDGGGDSLGGTVGCVCVGGDRLTEATELSWLTWAREVTAVSEVTVVEILGCR